MEVYKLVHSMLNIKGGNELYTNEENEDINKKDENEKINEENKENEINKKDENKENKNITEIINGLNENNEIERTTIIGGNKSIFDESKFYFEKFNQIESNITKISNDDLYKLIDNLLTNFSKNKFNDTIESLVYFYCSKYLDFEKRFSWKDDDNIKVYYIIFKIYPYLIYSLMYNKTIPEQMKIVKKLEALDEKYCIVIEKYSTNLEKYKSYLSNYYEKYPKNNACINFNNFIGIKFKATTITYNDMINNSKNNLIIHVGFNNEFDNVLYKSYYGINSNFLSYDDMLKFKIFEQVKTHKSDIQYEIMKDSKIICKYPNKQKMEKSENNYAIVLCYDDSDELNKCHFSITNNIYSSRNIDVLLNGGIIELLPLNVYKLYLSKMFYSRKNMLMEVVNNSDNINTATQQLKIKIGNLIKPCYDSNYKICIDKWVKEFPNEKYLKIYLQGLKSCCDIQTGKLIFEKYYEFVKLYFFPVLY